MVDCNKGMIALAHNGNLVNANEIRARLEAQGSIFQTTSDTEVIVHLIAQSKEQTLPEAACDALRRIEGAFSLVMMTRDRVFAIRYPRGFRPLSMGRIPHGAPNGDTVVGRPGRPQHTEERLDQLLDLLEHSRGTRQRRGRRLDLRDDCRGQCGIRRRYRNPRRRWNRYRRARGHDRASRPNPHGLPPGGAVA